MSVHLKSGCFSNADSNSSDACQKLGAQIPKLEEWIDTHAAAANPVAILGDFNRRLG